MTIFIIILAVVILWLIAVFNGLVRLRTRSEEAWSDIDVQLKRRYDLIPNLVETVKGYAGHESGVLSAVTEARSASMKAKDSGNRENLEKAENALSNTLKTLFAVSENYPDLKANANFLELQRELSDTENKIQASRRFYNSMVKDLNIRIATFPSSVVAKMFSFGKKEFFGHDMTAGEREAVKVKF